MARYVDISAAAMDVSTAMASPSMIPRRSSWHPSAASPHANCATLVLSKQSTQCDRRMPLWHVTASPRDASLGSARDFKHVNRHGSEDEPAPGAGAHESPPPTEAASKRSTPVTSSHAASLHAAIAEDDADDEDDDASNEDVDLER